MIKRERKTRCWACESLNVQRWGKQSGKQRFKCNNCDIYFTSSNDGVKMSNELVWFKKWVVERQTLFSLSRDSGISERTLRRKFSAYLKIYPKWYIPGDKVVNLVIDGTYFHNGVCLFIYRENALKETLFYRTTTQEYAVEIYEDLINIMSVGIIIESITSDGHKSALKAITEANKWIKQHNKANDSNIQPIVSQRCLVHIQRKCLTDLKKEHKSVEGQRLRHIAMTICRIDNYDKMDLFLAAINYWFEDNREYVSQFSCSTSGNKWRTHTDLYSAYWGIKRALPSMFHYIKNPKIPPTTNSLESYFSHLKADVLFHRGLSHSHFKNFIRWYVYLKNESKD